MNLPTVLALLLVGAVFVLAVTAEVKKRRSGKSACGGNCGSCSCGCGR